MLRTAWSLSDAQVGWLTTAVQLGFVAGTAIAALLNLPDVIPSRTLFATSAVAGAVANLGLAYTTSPPLAFVSRFVAGACLAGVYPPAMKMAATWFRARRGIAVGAIVGALTIGKAGPYLLSAVPGATVGGITWLASLSAVVAAIIVAVGYRDGPHAFPARPFAWSRLGGVVRSRPWRLALGGYLGHMAELYAYWTWIPAFLAASALRDPHALTASASPAVRVLAFAVIAVGGAGCVWGGLVADRIGRRPALMIPCTIALFISPIYLTTTDPFWITFGFILMGLIVGGKDTLNPAWLSERFPTEIRASASGFVYHQGAIWGGFVAPVLDRKSTRLNSSHT